MVIHNMLFSLILTMASDPTHSAEILILAPASNAQLAFKAEMISVNLLILNFAWFT